MKKHVFSAIGIVACTSVFLTVMLATDPLAECRELLLRAFHAAQYENAIVPLSNVYQDPRTQETSHGQHPLQSFTTLAEFWAPKPSDQRVYFMGNSQMYSIVLPPTEQTASGMDRTYPDMVFAHYASDSQSKMLFYRLAAWNIDYVECLWYLNYILRVPELRPNRILLQLTFQTFRLVGIRDGMLELLADPRFRSAITAEAESAKPYSSAFQEALERYDKSLAEQKVPGARAAGTGAQWARTSRTGIVESYGFGNVLESAVRQRLSRLDAWQVHDQRKLEFLNLMYLFRVFLLDIKPTTKRSIGGASLTLNLGALERIVELCRQQQIELVLMNAPENGSAPLYLTEGDRRRYHELIHQVADTHHLRLYDFEGSIPRECWGVWIDGPDPVHFGRDGHRRMAELLIHSGIIGLTSK